MVSFGMLLAEDVLYQIFIFISVDDHRGFFLLLMYVRSMVCCKLFIAQNRPKIDAVPRTQKPTAQLFSGLVTNIVYLIMFAYN